MNEKVILKILLIIMIIVNVIGVFKIFPFSKTEKQDPAVSPKELALLYSLKASYEINGRPLPDIALTNLQNQIVQLNEFLNNRKAIMLLYSEVSCNPCVDSLIAGCNGLVKKRTDTSTVIAVVHSSSISYVRRFARINDIKFHILWDPQELLASNLGVRQLPVVLMINENDTIVNSFFIVPEFREVNHDFFYFANRFLNEHKN